MVDDSAAVRGAIRNFLESKTRYGCDEANDGLSGIRTAEENQCELVLLDLNMPNLNGVKTAAILRRKLPQVKIVVFSALVRDADFKEQLLATKHFDVVLSKFDGLNRLVDVVKTLLPEPTIDS
ncbi:MAG: response regulator transcription factor [Candidatus Acidiferrum sp.]